MIQNFNNLYSWLEKRDYQIKAREDMTTFTKKWIKDQLTNDKNIDLWTSMPVLMATGSGKTATVGKHLHKIFLTRDRLERRNSTSYPLRVLILNDRINLVNQIKDDFIHGRDGKPPLLWEDIESHAIIKLYHSKADSTENTIVEDGIDIQWSGKDEIYFSTFLTAKKFDDENFWRDIIIIDEAQHLTGPTFLWKVSDNIAKSIQYNWKNPLIIPMSATMDRVRHLFNEPVVDFWLADYIASEYSPEIKYNLVTSTDFSNKDLEEIKEWIDEVSNITDFKKKKEKIEEIKKYIGLHLAKFGGTTDLCNDLLKRLDSIDHTIIFVNSIEEADKITTEVNRITGDDNTAVALHSKIDEASPEVLADYRSGKNKIIVAINMLNEGIDIPQTNNVVFWRSTKSSDLFQQQFGRWLRWDQVSFYDYTAVLANMAYINGINEEINKKIKRKWSSGGGWVRKGIEVLFGDINNWWENNLEYAVTLKDIIQRMWEIDKDLNLLQVWENGQIEIEGNIYQLANINTPSEQLWWIKWSVVKDKITREWWDWKELYMRKAKSNWKIANVYELNALKELLKNDISIPNLWENGQVKIDNQIYQWAWRKTPSQQLWGISGKAVIKKLIKQPQEWKDKFMKTAKSKAGIVAIYEINELKKILKDYIWLPDLWENGQVEIDGKIYQRIWDSTPKEQLWWMNGQTVKKRVKKQSQDWKDLFLRKAKSKTSTIDICEINELKKILKDDIETPTIWENGQVEIDGKIYQRTWTDTPKEQLWWMNGPIVKARLKKQSQEWKDKFMKRAKVKNWTVDVCEINELKKLLGIEDDKQDIHNKLKEF